LFANNPQNLKQLEFILANSANSYAQYLAATSIKNLLAENWVKINDEEK